MGQKLLVGQCMRMTLAENRTGELWRGFMPRRKEINRVHGTALYSVEVYDASLDFRDFNMQTPFDKWAAVEVHEVASVPAGMRTLTLAGGLYVVFVYRGAASAFQQAYEYIFGQWLSASAYHVDNRAHFAVMGEKYKGDDPSSEEEIWIPIRKKK